MESQGPGKFKDADERRGEYEDAIKMEDVRSPDRGVAMDPRESEIEDLEPPDDGC
jgi:hypothetical protein